MAVICGLFCLKDTVATANPSDLFQKDGDSMAEGEMIQKNF